MYAPCFKSLCMETQTASSPGRGIQGTLPIFDIFPTILSFVPVHSVCYQVATRLFGVDIKMEKQPFTCPVKRGAIVMGILLTVIAAAAVSPAAELSAAHQLQIELVPAEMKLNGKDDITVDTNGIENLVFRVSENLTRIKVQVGNHPRDFVLKGGRLQISLLPREKFSKLKVSIQYSGIFDDPVPVRPVNTDNPGYGVTATISPRGSFLLAGAGWYPELMNSRASYRVYVSAPAGLIAVTAGRSLGHTTDSGKTVSAWEVNYPVQGLALSVAPYVVEEKTVGRVTAATYLLPENQHLASSYLDATAGYIQLYTNLFGPYPFQKFAVVENFFPTGFGFPSYTLMGGSVLRLPFIVHTSLGHEIAHCWWGNSVYVDYEEGNWSEGLTTYVADYLFKEMKSPEDAQDYRRQWLKDFATLVPPEKDFALSRFESRYDPLTQTIGYDKGAMVFHMIRRLIGDEAFWGGLRDIYAQRRFKPTSWSDLQRAFEGRNQRSLQNFFDQWVYRKGAPRFALEVVSTERSADSWKVRGRITQDSPFFSFPLILALETRQQTMIRQIEVTGRETTFDLICADTPLKLTADPADDLLRRLDPAEIPPAVNSLKGSSSVVTVLTEPSDPALKQAAATLVLALGLKQNQFIAEDKLNRQLIVDHDLLIIGRPADEGLLKKMPARVKIQPRSFAIDTKVYDGISDAFFGVCEHPYAENRIAALFWPLSWTAADTVAAKITHYGKYSYLAFRDGKNSDKGFWPVEKSPLVYKW